MSVELGTRTPYQITRETVREAHDKSYGVFFVDLSFDRPLLPWLPRSAAQNRFAQAYAKGLAQDAGRYKPFVVDYVDGLRIADSVFRLHCEKNMLTIPEVRPEHYHTMLRSTRDEEIIKEVVQNLGKSREAEAVKRITDYFTKPLTSFQPELTHFIRDTGTGRRFLSTLGVFDGVVPYHLAMKMG